MAYPKPDDRSSSETIVYPVDHMRETAAKLLAQAGIAQSQHNIAWQKIQNTIYQDFDKVWQETLMSCLKPYVARLQASYDWQINLASALFDAVDAIEGTDDTTGQSFTPQKSGPQL
ncbi:MAG TPA: hypothetical protein VFV38_04110 [Ktedonobacteraceae bacterium]|nr:hypothetical protein [Ktedonobacteraceae bacterium]